MPPKITGAQPHLPWEVRAQLICLYWHFFREMLSLHTHPESIRLCVEHSSLDHRTYFQTSKGHVTWIIWKVNRIPMHCGVVYESVHLLARGHVIRMYVGRDKKIGVDDLVVFFHWKRDIYVFARISGNPFIGMDSVYLPFQSFYSLSIPSPMSLWDYRVHGGSARYAWKVLSSVQVEVFFKNTSLVIHHYRSHITGHMVS